jgi:hypothetical protein
MTAQNTVLNSIVPSTQSVFYNDFNISGTAGTVFNLFS